MKVVTECAFKNYNEDRDIEAGKSNSKDSSEDDNKDDNKDDRKDKEFQNKMDVDLDEPVKTLCYKHVTFILLQKPEAERDLLAMEIDLWFTKGHKWNYKW